MPITPKFIAEWFLFSAICFFALTTLYRNFMSREQPDRDLNTFLIIFSQGIGAAIAYALY